MATTSPADLNHRGLELDAIADYFGARQHYLAALKVDPSFTPALANLAALAGHGIDRQSKRVAVSLLQRLVALNPNDGNQWNNLGTFLMQLEEYDAAENAMDRARELAPDSYTTWHNLGLLYLRTKRPQLGLECLERVEALGRTSHSLTNDKAYAHMSMGELEAGLEFYESRWATLLHLPPWDHYIPEWKGESLLDKRILFHAEQGFGDTIMTSRFVAQLVALGAKVTIGVPPALVRLFEHQGWPIEVVDILALPDDAAKRFDYQSPMYSTMRWLGIKLPADISGKSYLEFPKLPTLQVNSNRLNIGICWASGARGTEMDWRRRVTPLTLWLSLAEIPEVQLWSLQKGAAEDEIATLGAEALIEDPTGKFSDWADTAAFMVKLDLVISVDTAVVHLAGALGKPTLMLSQYANCWRWWNIDGGNGRPWYDSVGIISANNPDDWAAQMSWTRRYIADYLEDNPRRAAA